MTRIQRRLLIDTSVIGGALTLLVAILSYFTRVLVPLDDWFYDKRASWCQNFAPPPTDKLMHVDIDDQALATLGQWPWPRSQLAELVDEIADAGAKAIFMDIIFSEESNPNPLIVETAPGAFKRVDNDAIFAAAIRRANNCLMPLALFPYQEPSPLYRTIRDYLTADLELNEADCYKRLLADPAKVLPPGSRFPDSIYVAARREAMNARVAAELDGRGAAAAAAGPTFDELRRRLLPRTDPEFAGSPLLRLLRDELQKVAALQPVQRYRLPMPPGLPPLVKYATELAPLRAFSDAAAYTGYVNYESTSESGVIRSIPLWADYRGRLFPQTDLSLACAVLGVDVRTVRISPDEVVIPRPPGRDHDIVIPVRSVYAPAFGRELGLFMDVPVRGTREWEFVYDHRRFKRAELHVPMSNVWDVHATGQRIAKNNANLDRAIYTLLATDDPDPKHNMPPSVGLDDDRWRKYRDHPPAAQDTAARKAMVDAALAAWRDYAKDFGDLTTRKDAEVEGRDRLVRDELIAAFKTFASVLDQNQRFESQLAAGRANLRDRFAGRAIMIGWTASGRTDTVPTAIQPACPGVVIHGLVFNAIMTENFWRHAPRWVTALLVVVIGLLVTAANGFLRPSYALICTVVLAVAYLLINGLLLFDYGHWCVGVAGPMVALGSVWATSALAGFLIEAKERARITKRFSSYVDQKLVDHVLENPDTALDGQVREMSVVFTDLAGFTSLSEQLRERTVPILSDYLGRMVPLIRKNDGFVNKFLGDGIMCFWNAPNSDPDHAAHAVLTVLEMQVAMKDFAEEMVDRGLPRVSMRCGVSTGTMVVGDSGPADAADYTVLGDAVNFASRLESANKAIGTKILVSQRTSELVADRYLLRAIGKLQVVGKTEGVMAYEPLATIDEATPDELMLCAISAEMVAAYTAADFVKCVEVADRMDATFGPGKLADLYRKICKRFIETPPEAFDGNLILTEK